VTDDITHRPSGATGGGSGRVTVHLAAHARTPRPGYDGGVPACALTVRVAPDDADDVAALLLDAGAAGAEVRDGSVAPMPGVPRPPAGRAEVVAFFGSRAEAEEAAAALGVEGRLEELADRDWSEAWKEGLAPFAVGRVFVRPSWIAAAPPPGAVEVVLDPGMAFGTGTHPTTALCLAGLDALLRERPGAAVLDVGTGSGLLAIAAARLGARRVAATENDPVALRVAEENAARNGVGLEAHLAPPEAVPGTFEVVVANILANTLVELAPGIASRLAPGGTLLLSGIVSGQEEEVRAAYRARGLAARPELDRAEGEWRLLAMRSPG
jgi:ribosomal protein L11 methyltransferase